MLAIVTVPARCADQPWQPSSIGPERHGIEELVVDAAVDDVDAPAALRRAHVDAVAGAEQVATLDQLDAHQTRQQRVLEVGAVEGTGGEHHDDRLVDARGRGGGKRGEQPARVVADRTDAHA